MNAAALPTQDRVRELLDYDPLTGIFRWRANRNSALVGAVTGFTDTSGHLRIWIDGRKYAAHRLAWLYVYGEWPSAQIDHRDLNPKNNAINNLREASPAQNRWNARALREDGRKGVVARAGGKWEASIWASNKRHYLGRFDSAESAHAAYAAAAIKHHGDFARVS